MSALISFLRQLAGLFVDDGWLAFAILCIVALAAVVPTANANQLTHARESVDSSIDERFLQADLVRLDRAVPVAGCIGS